jgi:hypothetical protein
VFSPFGKENTHNLPNTQNRKKKLYSCCAVAGILKSGKSNPKKLIHVYRVMAIL